MTEEEEIKQEIRLNNIMHNGAFLSIMMLCAAALTIIMWYYNEWPKEEIVTQAAIFYGGTILIGLIMATYSMTKEDNKMGLFKRIGIGNKKTKEEGTTEAPIHIDPVELLQNTVALSEVMGETLKNYEYMINNGHSLNLAEYKAIMNKFVALAQDFEKVYEIMRFDVEKLEEIQKYHEKSQSKRQQLIEQLEKDTKTPEPPKTNGKNGKPPKK